MSRDITALSEADRADIFEVINGAAKRYGGLIPEAADTDPYMSMEELEREMADIHFFGVVRDRLVGVIGIQERTDVTLIRHLYVRPASQREGVGTELLETGIEYADSERILVGTWNAATWAIEFYEDRGFENLGTDTDLLTTYWDIPEHQVEASVVLRFRNA